jgi:hypothetical protein
MAPLRPTLKLLLAWFGLSLCENLRFPGSEPKFWYLLPAVDVTVLFSLFAATTGRFRSVATRSLWILTSAFVFLRLLRVGDGIQWRFLSTTFNLYMDLPLLPELARLYYSTVPLWKVVLTCFGVLLGLGALVWMVHGCLRWALESLADPKPRRLFFATTALCLLASPFFGQDAFRLGGFARSALPRLLSEFDYLVNGPRYRARVLAEVARVHGKLRQHSLDLIRLGGANVYLFLIESYGQVVLDDPDLSRGVRPSYSLYEWQLGPRGFHVASALLDSPTYGGSSWLAHATLGTGVFTEDQFRYRAVCESQPLTLAKVFHGAGYKTILAGPATTRPWPEGDFYGFDVKYYSWNFDYQGPRYAWALMPDQYVIDFIRRAEILESERQRFIQYALVSSHAPWSNQPPVVRDDTAIGNGHVFTQLRARTFPTDWSNMTQARPAYLHAIRYDLEVIRRYIAKYVADDALVIILGDHQPNGDITGQSAAHGVPVHVLSRNQAVIDLFLARGYGQGMTPDTTRPHLSMAEFFPSLVVDLSTSSR